MIIKKSNGYNAKEAYGKLEISAEIIKNASSAWKSQGCPEGDDFIAFAQTYASKNLKEGKEGVFYVVKSKPENSSKIRPYSTEIIATEGLRKFATAYEIIGIDSNKKYETVVGKKSNAIKIAKKYVKDNKESVEMNVVKVCVEGISKAAIVTYKPSINNVQGEFIFFGKVSDSVNI